MNCPKCNQAVEAGATFCGNCGQPLLVAPAEAQPVPPAAQPVPAPVASSTLAAPAATQPPATPPTQAPAAQPATAPAPQLATAPAPQPKGNTKAIVGLVIGVIAMPSALIPLFGLPLGIIGLILGTTSRKANKKILSTLAIVFSALAIVGSFAAAAYNVQKVKSGSTNYNLSSSSSSSAKITTPCYSVTIPAAVSFGKSNGCNYEYKQNGYSLVIGTSTVPSIASSDIDTLAKGFKDGFTERGHSVLNDKVVQLAGSPAHKISLKTSNGVYGSTILAFHGSSQGPNVFSILYSDGGTNPDLSIIESSWQWR